MADRFQQESLNLAIRLQMEEATAIRGGNEEADANFTIELLERELVFLHLSHQHAMVSPHRSMAGPSNSTRRNPATNDEQRGWRERIMDVPIPGEEPATAAPTNNNDGDARARAPGAIRGGHDGPANPPGGSTQQSGTASCASCMNDIPTSNIVQFPCAHVYCLDCTEGLIRVSIADGHFPPQCCSKPLTPGFCQQFIPPELLQQFRDKQEEYNTPTKIYCHGPECGKFIPTESIQGRTATCPGCNQTTCVDCRGPSHQGDCPPDPDREQMLRLGRESGWRACQSCGNMVERTFGCNHMSEFTQPQFFVEAGKNMSTLI